MLTAITGASDQRTLLGHYEAWLQPALIWLHAVAAKAATGEINVEAGLSEANDKFTRYRACVINRQAFNTFTEWRECALEVDPDLGRRYN